jgi:acetolactate synthase-1/2/3 large subunit
MDQAVGMTNVIDGGEAILEAFRNLGVDYVISSPGSEWAPVWEAFARQKLNATPGPTYIDCGHETIAVNMALGYTQMTGRMQAVLLHAGTGLLQGSMGIHGAQFFETPMIIMSGEALSYGEDPDYEPGTQWQRSLSVVGGPQRLVEPFVKWANQATSIHTLYQSTVRAGEIAQRTPKGPTYICMPMETMMEEWMPPARMHKVDLPPKLQAAAADIERIAALIRGAKSPIITTEVAGRDPDGFAALVELAEKTAIPVVEGRGAACANFPKEHPLYLGAGGVAHLKQADLILVVASRVPFYPPRNVPADARIVVISDNPHKTFMVYQNLQADDYLEGDVASSLRGLTKALSDGGASATALDERRARWRAAHDKFVAGLREAEAKAPRTGPVEPLVLCEQLRAVMPKDTIYVDETVTYGTTVHQHLSWNLPQSFFRTPTGLGQGLGMSLGVKLAAGARPVVLLTGDGSFLYNPVLPGLGAAKANNIPILVVVFNNHEYKSMKRNHLDLYPRGIAKQTGIHYGNKVDTFDYAELAKLFGGFGRRVDDATELKQVLAEALDATRNGTPAVLNVVMSR